MAATSKWEGRRRRVKALFCFVRSFPVGTSFTSPPVLPPPPTHQPTYPPTLLPTYPPHLISSRPSIPQHWSPLHLVSKVRCGSALCSSFNTSSRRQQQQDGRRAPRRAAKKRNLKQTFTSTFLLIWTSRNTWGNTFRNMQDYIPQYITLWNLRFPRRWEFKVVF